MTDRSRTNPAPTAADERVTAAQRHLAGPIGHDLNNLLFVLEGSLNLLHDSLADDPGLAGPFEAIERATQLIGMLAANLLTFAGRQTLHAEAVDVTAILSRGLAALHRLLPAGIRLDERIPTDLWPVCADPRLLLFAILNLGLNSRDAMPHGGRLIVAAENRFLEPGSALGQAVAQAGDYVALAFQDSGSGMTEARIARVLAHDAPRVGPDEDLPLGLPMVRTMARALGGGMLIESAPDRGTAVTLCLPRAV